MFHPQRPAGQSKNATTEVNAGNVKTDVNIRVRREHVCCNGLGEARKSKLTGLSSKLFQVRLRHIQPPLGRRRTFASYAAEACLSSRGSTFACPKPPRR